MQYLQGLFAQQQNQGGGLPTGTQMVYPQGTSAADYPTLASVGAQPPSSQNYLGPQSTSGAGFYQPDPQRPWGSVLDIARGIPSRAAADILQIPTGLLEYGLGRFAEPGSMNQARNIDAAQALANLQQGAGRAALFTDQRTAQMAGIDTITVPRGFITKDNFAEYGFSPEDYQFFPYITQVPRHLARQYTSPEDELKRAQMANQQAQADYFRRFSGGIPQAEPPPGTVVTGGRSGVTMTPRGPTVSGSTTYGTPDVPTGGGEPPAAQLPVPPRAGRVPPPGTGAIQAPGAQTPQGKPAAGAPAPAPTQAAPTPQAAPAAPAAGGLGKPGSNVTLRDDRTGETFSGTLGTDGKTITSPTGEARVFDGQNLTPAGQTAYPSPAFQEPGAAAGAALGGALGGRRIGPIPAAPIQGPGPGVAPQPGDVGYASFAPPPGEQGPTNEPGRIAVPGPIGGGAPAPPTQAAPPPAVQRPKEVATPGAPTPQMKQDYYAAQQQDPSIKAWLDQHPELKTTDQKIWATAGAVDRWKRDQKIIDAERMTQARLATPVRTQLNAINAMLVRFKTYTNVLENGKIALDVFQDNPTQTEIGQLLEGTGLDRFISPGRVGVPNPLNPSGPQIIETIPGIAKRKDHPDYQAANIILQNENGLLAELARATSVSGRLTNYEQQLMKKAYVPTAGIDDRISAIQKVKNTVATLQSLKEAIMTGQLTNSVDIQNMIRGGAGASTGPRLLQAQPEEPRTLQAPPPAGE